MFRLNPDIERSFWLEFSLHRLVMMPVIFGLIFWMCSFAPNPYALIGGTAQTMFLLLIFLWGGHKAASAVADEIHERTWDFQRLSMQSPWSLTFSKLFASASYVWYGAFILLAVFIYCAFHEEGGRSFVHDNVVYHVSLMVLGALICHATALFLSLLTIQRVNNSYRKVSIIFPHIGGLLLAYFFWALDIEDVLDGGTVPTVMWYGTKWDGANFSIFRISLAIGWLLLGIYQQMRVQLRMRSGPWMWLAFTIFCIWFFIGFVPGEGLTITDQQIQIILWAMVMMGVLFLYVIAFIEGWSPLQYRRVIQLYRQSNKVRMVELLPRWVGSTLVVGVLIAVSFCVVILFLTNSQAGWNGITSMIILLGFVLRDIMLLHYFRFSPKGTGRAVVTTIVYLILLYSIIPGLLNLLGLHMLAACFYPVDIFAAGLFDVPVYSSKTLSPPFMLLSAMIQVAITGSMAYRRWKKHWQLA